MKSETKNKIEERETVANDQSLEQKKTQHKINVQLTTMTTKTTIITRKDKQKKVCESGKKEIGDRKSKNEEKVVNKTIRTRTRITQRFTQKQKERNRKTEPKRNREKAQKLEKRHQKKEIETELGVRERGKQNSES